MTSKKILIIEDEEDIIRLVSYNLKRDGYEVTGVTSGEEGLRLARLMIPDMILLDLMLPGIDGLQVCKLLRQENEKTKGIPIIMLTAKGEESDVILGLEFGADDYITKPFSPNILRARVRTLFRRQSTEIPSESATLNLCGILIDPNRFQVLFQGVPIDLTVTEFHILHYLARRPGWVFTRYQIVDAVRGEDYSVTERSVDVHIVNLRKKLGTAGKCIETVRGIGYRFTGEKV